MDGRGRLLRGFAEVGWKLWKEPELHVAFSLPRVLACAGAFRLRVALDTDGLMRAVCFQRGLRIQIPPRDRILCMRSASTSRRNCSPKAKKRRAAIEYLRRRRMGTPSGNSC